MLRGYLGQATDQIIGALYARYLSIRLIPFVNTRTNMESSVQGCVVKQEKERSLVTNTALQQ